MNDADLGDNVDQHAHTVESQLPGQDKYEQTQAHRFSSRWWFASSAFPMIAGTLGPVASAFSICALVRPWRQLYPPGTNVAEATFVKDPPWLTIVNAIQLVVAIVSNVFLLLNMTRRIRFSIAQPITIAGWYISAVCLIGLTATAAGPLTQGLDPVNHYIWSQAYYYGIWAAILYFVVASLMVVTFSGALAGHYPKDFNLTASQRTLMLQTIMFLMYLLLGALVFSNVEGWNYLDAVYWADVTLFTVGYGDYSPSTRLGQALLMPYALVGVISLGLVIGSIRSLVLERGKRQMDARMEEKRRRRTVKTMSNNGKDILLEPIHADTDMSSRDPDGALPATEFERRNAEFDLMRKIQRQASTRRKWIAMAVSTGTWLILWLVGAHVFYKCENPYQPFWSYFDSVYFCFISLTTIGYGDLTPISNAGKSFFVFWSLLALPTMTVLISNAGDTVVKFIKDATLRLGNVTILPGEGDFMADVKHIINKLSCGYLFPNHVDFVPPSSDQYRERIQAARGQATLTSKHYRKGSNVKQTGPEYDGNITTKSEEEQAGDMTRFLSNYGNPVDELPTGTEYHYLLIAEIEMVSKHLRHKKPRVYSFEEWAWYLKLMGEDERSPDTHRKPAPKTKDPRDSVEEGQPMKWSWVGNGSPLVGGHEESEWILDRLTKRLKECLAAERKHRRAEASSKLGHATKAEYAGDVEE
ncbi:Outward-rectifier potassium channel TOK1 [Paramyrothecium foliicola]|nr:Outward-rectifier potassium channel TOK1 [Paramyrothecium foliicola]